MRARNHTVAMSEEVPIQTDTEPSGENPEVVESATDGATQEPTPEPAAPVDPLIVALGEAARWKDLAARAQAELDNYRKRMARDKADAIKFGNSGLLSELLPIIDNFQMGLDAAKAEGDDSIIGKGMEMVLKQINEFLTSQGAVEVEAVGQAFDPNQHEALSQEHSDEIPEGNVIAVLRRGFRLHDRLLRAANVIVSKGPEVAGNDK
jgi:molecular chaperone GrpE